MENSSPIARQLTKALPASANLKTLLARIHYAPSLIEFSLVAENLVEILPVAKAILGEEYSREIDELQHAANCVHDAMPQLGKNSKFSVLRPLLGVGVEGHFPNIKESYPLYVALGFPVAAVGLAGTYRLLQAYIFAGIIGKGVNKEDLPPHNLTRLEAFRQVRNLATFDLQAILAGLPSQRSQTPQDYIKHLVECEAPELTEVIIFLRALFEVKERGGLGNQASHSSGRRSRRRFEEGEEDPESGRDVVAISPLTEQQRDVYETRGGCPDEIQSRTVSVDPGTRGLEARTWAEIRKLKAAARERLNRVATANQGLHFDWSELTVDEAASLLMSLSVDRLDVDPVARMCLLTSFWIGMPVDDVLQLHFSSHPSNRPGFSGLVISGEKTYWQIHSPGPDVKHREYDKAMPVNQSILLKVPPSAEGFIKKYHNEFLSGKRSGVPLFNLNTEDGVARCMDFLGKLRGERYPRITLNRIANFLVAQISRSPSGEIAVADLITGIDHPRSHNKIHYTTISTKALQKLYDETCRSIEARLLRSHLLVDPDKICLTGSSSESCTGSPLRPQEGAVRNLVASMLGNIRTGRPSKAWANAEIAAFHNTFTLYTTQMLKSCAGIRAIRNPSIEFRHLDLSRGFAVIGDKLRDDGMGSRMIWIPPQCVRQLKYYSAHLETLFSRCAHLSPSLARLFARQRGNQGLTDLFLLDQNLEVSILTPALIEESLRSRHGYNLPANTNRHTLRSRLLESGCPPEVIDACMGHAEVGEEPWTRYSFLHPHDYANTLKKHLLPILNQDGWVAVPGLERSLELTDLVLDTTGWPLPKSETTPYAPPRTASISLAKEAVQDTLQRLQPQMLRQEPSFSLSKEDVDAIVDDLKRRKGLETWRCIDELNKVILMGRENLGWTIPTTTRHMKVMREKPLVTEETFEYRAVCQGIENALEKSLERPAPGNLQARLGQLLLSGILWGGLQESRWVRAWPGALANGMQLWQDWLWVDLDIAPDAAQDAQEGRDTAAWRNHRIWVADPVTQLLLLRWRKQFPQDRNAAGRHGAWSCIQACLKTLPGKFTRPDNLSQLLEIAAARSATTLPGALAAYATGELPAISMSQETWHRFMTDRPVIVSRPAKQVEAPVPPRPFVPYPQPNDQEYDPRRQQQLFKEMMRLFPVKTATGVTRVTTAKAALKTFAATHAGELSTVFVLLIQWAIQLFEKRGSLHERRLGRGLKVSTVRSYLSTIGEDLLLETSEADQLLETGKDDLLALSSNDLELMYERIVYAYPSTDARYRAAHRLAQFHGYLYATHRAKQVDFDTLLLDVGDVTANVDANLVMPPEYRRILSYLGWGRKKLPRMRTMQIIVTILMFRCGLRRSEVHGLRIIDVQYEIAPCLLIRTHRYADTKSLSARRIIPLESLLEPEELRFVLSWVTKRNKESKTRENTLLLHDPTVGPSYVPGSLLFDPVTEALHKVTGDRTLCLHNLRHSFASWLIVRLGMRDDIAVASLPMALRDPIFSSAERRLLKKRLFANELLGRKYLYAVKMLLGHSDVRTTIYNYTHVMDWLLGYLVRHASWLPNLSVAAEKQVSATGHTAVFSARRQTRGKNPSLLKLIQNASSHHRDQLTGTFPVRRGRPPATAATTDRLTLPSFEEVLDRLSQPTGEPGHPLPPTVPRYRQELVYAAQLYGQLRSLTGSARTTAHRTLRTAFARFDRETNEVLVDSTTWGREFAQTLRALKVPPSCWALSHHPRKGQAPEEAGRYRQKWAGTLGVAQGAITMGPSGKGPMKGRLALKICRPPSPVKDQQKGKKQREPTERRLARYGFQFFLFMARRAVGD